MPDPLESIFVTIEGEKIFPFKIIDMNKGNNQARKNQLEQEFRALNNPEIENGSPEFKKLVEYVSLLDDREGALAI